jgi:hypothetical protein
MKILIIVTQEELDEMELSEDSLAELIYDSEVSDDLVGFDVEIQTN